MNRIATILLMALIPITGLSENAIHGLMDRLSAGLSKKINVYIDNADDDYFSLFQDGDKPSIKANSTISAAVGLNHYLKYCAGIHICWNNLSPNIPDKLPAVNVPIYRSTHLPLRYYLNYCTHSYSMAFWDWERWQKEVDWMALHGINMPLTITGMRSVWRNTLRRLGMSDEKITPFIAGKGYEAWWLMSNLEGMGGQYSTDIYDQESELQNKILERMRLLGMQPVLPGYAGMIPHDCMSENGDGKYQVGQWCGFERPGFIPPSDTLFNYVADIYYEELTKLYGRSKFYSMDPFHEGGAAGGIDLSEAGQTIMQAMKRCNPDAVWVAQGWQHNPQPNLIKNIPLSNIIILDLQAENHPQWGKKWGDHEWLYCMLLNFGGNVGMHGKIDATNRGFAEAFHQSTSLRGVGLSMEGIENNPVMYEFMTELPWIDSVPNVDQWLSNYSEARYGFRDPRTEKAWRILHTTVYGCPDSIVQQGCRESIFCARPSLHPTQASTWASTKYIYDHSQLRQAATLLLESASDHTPNKNLQYDIVDVTRQYIADEARAIIDSLHIGYTARNICSYKNHAKRFLQLLDKQNTLLGTIKDFRVGTWIEDARNCAPDSTTTNIFEKNARRLITTWGDREASENGGLHDYAHREWHGILTDLYAKRWKLWFDAVIAGWNENIIPEIDFYDIDNEWVISDQPYNSSPEGDPIETAASILGIMP